MQSWSRVIKAPSVEGGWQLPIKAPGAAGGSKAELAPAEATQMAQESARKLLADTEAQCQTLREEAKDQGFKEGYLRGMEQARQDAQEQRRQAEVLLREAYRLRAEILRNCEADAIELALDLTAKVICRQVELAPETVQSLAAQSLREACRSHRYLVFANPGDVPLLEEGKADLIGAVPVGAELQVVPDESVRRGGCRIETENGQLEATIDGQLDVIREALLKGVAG